MGSTRVRFGLAPLHHQQRRDGLPQHLHLARINAMSLRSQVQGFRVLPGKLVRLSERQLFHCRRPPGRRVRSVGGGELEHQHPALYYMPASLPLSALVSLLNHDRSLVERSKAIC